MKFLKLHKRDMPIFVPMQFRHVLLTNKTTQKLAERPMTPGELQSTFDKTESYNT